MIILIVAQFCRPFIKYGGVTERNVKDRIILGNFVPSNVSVVMLKFQENKASGVVRGDSILSNVTLLKCRSCRSIAEMFRTAISFFRNSNVGGRERENLKKKSKKKKGGILQVEQVIAGAKFIFLFQFIKDYLCQILYKN